VHRDFPWPAAHLSGAASSVGLRFAEPQRRLCSGRANLKTPFGGADSLPVPLLRSRRRRLDSGFTLAEVMVAMLIVGIVGTIAVWGLRTYQRQQQLNGTAHAVVGALRNAAEQAQSEGRTYCVRFDGNGKSWEVWRYSCQSGWSLNGNTAARVLRNQQVQGSDVSLNVKTAFAAAVNAGSCPAGSLACVYFYPRGTASGGALNVSRGGPAFTVNVEGLTGRVYMG
jgi:type II secretion system protein H